MKIAIAGAGGRMGRTLIDAVLADRELELGCRVRRAAAARARQESSIGPPTERAAACDVLIDFTRPEGTLAHLQARARDGDRHHRIFRRRRRRPSQRRRSACRS